MGEGCELLDVTELKQRFPEIAGPESLGALWSPHELRVESADALPKLADWLAREHGVVFRTGETVYGVLTGTGLGYDNHWAPVTIGPDGTAYGDMREEYCVYSIEQKFWQGRPLDGIGGGGTSAGDKK